MNDKFLSYQRYPKQILGDDKVLAMDWDARGMHNWLLDISWQQEPRGTLPADHAVLRRLLGSPSDETWRRVWQQISPAWPIQPDGRLGNLGMIRTAEKKEHYANGNANKGANRSQTGTQTPRKPPDKENEKICLVEKTEEKTNSGKVCLEEFDGEMWIRAILNSYPRADQGYAAKNYVWQALEAELEENKGWSHTQAAELVHMRVKLFAEHVKRWPKDEIRFVPTASNFFERRLYMQDEKFWVRNPVSHDSLKELFDENGEPRDTA